MSRLISYTYRYAGQPDRLPVECCRIFTPVIRFVLQSRKEGLFIAELVDYEEGNRRWQILNTANSLKVLLSITSEQIDLEAYYSFPLP